MKAWLLVTLMCVLGLLAAGAARSDNDPKPIAEITTFKSAEADSAWESIRIYDNGMIMSEARHKASRMMGSLTDDQLKGLVSHINEFTKEKLLVDAERSKDPGRCNDSSLTILQIFSKKAKAPIKVETTEECQVSVGSLNSQAVRDILHGLAALGSTLD